MVESLLLLLVENARPRFCKVAGMKFEGVKEGSVLASFAKSDFGESDLFGASGFHRSEHLKKGSSKRVSS